MALPNAATDFHGLRPIKPNTSDFLTNFKEVQIVRSARHRCSLVKDNEDFTVCDGVCNTDEEEVGGGRISQISHQRLH